MTFERRPNALVFCAMGTRVVLSPLCKPKCRLLSYTHIVHVIHMSRPGRFQKSHLPSFHPVLHLSSHLLQSNVCLPNFSLTALCASHIHSPNSLRLLTLGVFFCIHFWKSAAHTQQGYSLQKVERNDLVSAWSWGDGLIGYVAVIEWRSVHDERPSASTSGGQSAGSVGVVSAVAVAVAVGCARFLGSLPDMANREATSLQVRHLECKDWC